MKIFDEDLPPENPSPNSRPRILVAVHRERRLAVSERLNNQQLFFYEGTMTTSRVSIPGGRTRSRKIFLTTSTGLVIVNRE